MEWSEGGEWDNCNSIINKYIFLKKQFQCQNEHKFFVLFCFLSAQMEKGMLAMRVPNGPLTDDPL